MPWLGAIAGKVPRAWIGLPCASVVPTTSAEGFGAGEAGSTVATSSQPAGKEPIASPEKSSLAPIGAQLAARGANDSAPTSKGARNTATQEPFRFIVKSSYLSSQACIVPARSLAMSGAGTQ